MNFENAKYGRACFQKSRTVADMRKTIKKVKRTTMPYISLIVPFNVMVDDRTERFVQSIEGMIGAWES